MRSDGLEPLVDVLAERLNSDPLPDPMALETVAVPSRGSERWLSQRLAGRLGATTAATTPDGVCAGIAFPFPGAVIDSVVAAVEGTHAPVPSQWSKERLVWRVLEVVDELAADADADSRDHPLAPLRSHLRGHDGVEAARRLPLARRIAAAFDRYALLRPTMVTLWEQGVDAAPSVEVAAVEAREGAEADAPLLAPAQRWQPHLWRLLERRLGESNPAERVRAATVAVRHGDVDPAVLPARLSVFGVTALPPAHLRLLAALGERVEVVVYLLCASPALWGTASAELRNPLLSSLGGVGAGMAWSATGLRDGPRDGAEVEIEDLPSSRAGAAPVGGDGTSRTAPSLLEQLQHDLVADAAPGEAPAAPLDGSVQVHGCHGPSRQVEVLREVIAGLLADDPSLEPRDVLVMTPDLDTFAPLVSAVFDDLPGDGDGEAAPALPARIADRRLDAHNDVAAATLRLLELADARVTASQVLDLLSARPVADRFGLDDDVDTLTRWLRETGVRWGIDATHRDERTGAGDGGGSPGEAAALASLGAEHTFAAGLERLRLGVAVHDDGAAFVGDVVPYDDVEAEDVERLGRLSRALATVLSCVRALGHPRTVPEWHAAILEAVDTVTAVDRNEAWQRAQVGEVVAAIADEVAPPVGSTEGPEVAAAAPALTLAEVRTELARRLGRQPGAALYATGAITFCEPAPLRAVPHRVICLLGLDDGAFPRSPSVPGFDLVAAEPQPADREPRAEDRQLLLDAVLACRHHLVVTYSSRDPRTNERVPPAAPLGELLDAVAATAGADPAEADRLVVHHPLHPFDPGYFTSGAATDDARGAGPGLPASFDPSLVAAAHAHRGPRAPAGGFVDGPLPPPEAGLDPVSLDALEAFLRNPLREVLRHRLGVAVRDDDEAPDDRDPFELGGLDGWRLLAERLTLPDAEARRRWDAVTRRRGALPAGAVGAHELRRLDATAEALHDEARQALGRDPQAALSGPAVPVEVALDAHGQPARLTGEVSGLVDGHLALIEASRHDDRAELRAWVRLLALAASGHPVEGAVVVGRGPGRAPSAKRSALRLDDEARAAAPQHLGELVAVYARGQRDALPLMPRTCAALLGTLATDPAVAWQRAERAWSEGDYPEGADDAVVLALGPDTRAEEVLTEAVVAAARLVWEPLLAAGRRAKERS